MLWLSYTSGYAYLDEVHSAASEPDTSLERLPVSMSALEQRQQRRVYVEQPTAPLTHKLSSQHSHEASQAYDVHSGCQECSVHGWVKLCPTAVLCVLDYLEPEEIVNQDFNHQIVKGYVTKKVKANFPPFSNIITWPQVEKQSPSTLQN